MEHTTSRAERSLEDLVLREWRRLSPERRTGIALRDFEQQLWQRSLRLGSTPFLHHQGVMRVIGPAMRSAGADGSRPGALFAGGLADAGASIASSVRQWWGRLFSPRLAPR